MNKIKKLIGYLLSHGCFHIGDLFGKISMVKKKGDFLFDSKPWLMKIGMWLAGNYQRFMHYSVKIQDWADNESPWQKVK